MSGRQSNPSAKVVPYLVVLKLPIGKQRRLSALFGIASRQHGFKSRWDHHIEISGQKAH
jgi:hypothetical protein